MDIGRVLMLGLVGLMLLGVLAIVIWVFRVAFQSARGIAKTVTAAPAEALRQLGFSVVSDAAGGVAEGPWKGVPVKVGWRMTAANFAGDLTPPPEFSTTLVAYFTQPLGLGINVYEETGAPACGIPGLDGHLRLSAALTPHAHGLMTHWAPHIRKVLDAPGRLEITDAYVAINFPDIVGDKNLLSDALENVCTLHEGMRPR